ncbi:proteoglycan 4 [Scaptodrosophila lebanonensis]|uniref:Proteoglycan 4 n=1 Tax=Drosophila lebanonensis TaxID=7225 RepID=A0A6J2TP02_DROLE|nr:proteoglycan 4 [Scaptodrosophila lebanonensis]
MRRYKLLLSCLVGMLLLLQMNEVHSNSEASASNIDEAGPSESLIKQATEFGLDVEVLNEMVRSKVPVIISKTNYEGQTTTTAYRLAPDGKSIESETIGGSEPVPVRKTSERLMAAPAPSSAASGPESDWEWAPNVRPMTRPLMTGIRPTFSFGGGFGSNIGANWPSFISNQQPSFTNTGTTIRTSFGQLPSWHNTFWNVNPNFGFPAGVTPQTSTKTEVDDQGRTVTTTTKEYKGGIPVDWHANGAPQIPSLVPQPNRPSIFHNLPEGVTPKTSTKTEVDDQGRTVTTTTKEYKGGIPVDWHARPSLFDSGAPQIPSLLPQPNRPSIFDNLPEGVTPKTTTKTEVDDQGRTVTTTTKIYKGPLPSSWFPRSHTFDDVEPTLPNRPTLFGNEDRRPIPSPTRPSLVPLPTPARPPIPTSPPQSAPQPSPVDQPDDAGDERPPLGMITTTPLPSLEEFLKQQPNYFTTTSTTAKPLATINIDDLPVRTTYIKLPPKQPIDNDWLNGLTDSIKPLDSADNTQTKVTSISSTYTSAGVPSKADLDPQLQGVLTRAGITDEDIQNSNGQSVVRERVEPDGRVIKTTYTVRTVPINYNGVLGSFNGGSGVPIARPVSEPLPSLNPNHKEVRSVHTIEDIGNPIDQFLALVSLRPEQIIAQNGELIKTIVDNNGRVLSVRFVLSDVKGPDEPLKLQRNPPQK